MVSQQVSQQAVNAKTADKTSKTKIKNLNPKRKTGEKTFVQIPVDNCEQLSKKSVKPNNQTLQKPNKPLGKTVLSNTTKKLVDKNDTKIFGHKHYIEFPLTKKFRR